MKKILALFIILILSSSAYCCDTWIDGKCVDDLISYQYYYNGIAWVPWDKSTTTSISGNLNVTVTADSVGLATSANQTNASQKTKLVDGSGNVIGSTSNALDINIKSGNPTTITATQGTGSNLKVEASNNGTFAVQPSNTYLPLATNVSSTLTLTSASTAYQITEPTSNFIVTYCNNSDTDMYWGFATLTTGGILLAKNGGSITFVCSANSSPFFYCASAGKVLNYTTSVL